MQHIDLNNKTILVTGAAGFIGSNLVKRLLNDFSGITVVGIDNMNDYYDVSLKESRLKELQNLSPGPGPSDMLNAVEPGSEVPIHRHRNTSETVVCLRGKLVEEYYDDLERMCTESIVLTPNGQTVALNIPAGQWHIVRVLESGTVIMEVKDGGYEPIQDCDVLQ